MATIPKQIVDKNGKHTTVHVSTDPKPLAKSRPTAMVPLSVASPVVDASAVDIDAVIANLEEFNVSGDMLFIPGSLRVTNRRMAESTSTGLAVTSLDGVHYNILIQTKPDGDGTIAIWKDYNQDHEFFSDDDLVALTSAQPYVRREFSQLKDDIYHGDDWHSDVVADNVFGMLENIHEGDDDWNASIDAARFMYFGEDFEDINRALRNGTELNTTLIDTLDVVMAQDTLTEPVTVYRGIRAKDDSDREKYLSGYVEKSYMSTTVNARTAEGFAGGKGRGGLVAKITLPAGTKCYNLSDDPEGEIALGRDFDLSAAEWTVLD